MTRFSTSRSRMRRSTAGINKHYDEQDYALVSFPLSNKHSVIPTSCIDIDPLDQRNGSIDTFGSRKNLRIIASGTEEVMKERALRYGASAGSAEVELMIDQQDNDDDEYSVNSPHRTSKRSPTRKRSKSQFEITESDTNHPTTKISKHKYSKCTRSSKKNSSSERQWNFNHFYSKKSRPRNHFNNNLDKASSSESDENIDENLSIIKKIDELQSLLEHSRRQRDNPTVQSTWKAEETCSGCRRMNEEIIELRRRLEQMEERLLPIKGFSLKNPLEITGIKPDDIKSTSLRPTMVMRELIKKSGHIADKSYFQEHQRLFKEFIQFKCAIPDHSMDAVWKEIKDSLARQHLDEESNKKKKIRQEQFTVSMNSTVPEPTQTLATDANKEEVAVTLETVESK